MDRENSNGECKRRAAIAYVSYRTSDRKLAQNHIGLRCFSLMSHEIACSEYISGMAFTNSSTDACSLTRLFAALSVKVPMVPVHLWLPEAHVEAPTAGSVLLAGILLKMGTYGLLRFSIPMFPEATRCFTPFICTISVIAILYTSFTTIRQIDLKKIIAYSSVAHMNFVTIGMFSRA